MTRRLFRNIEFNLEKIDDRPVAINNTANFLEQLQLSINHIGDYLTGSDFRNRGPSPDSVRRRCNLVFRRIEIGSLKMEVELEDKQHALEGEALGEASIRKFHEIIGEISNGLLLEEELKKMITHPLHRNRIIEDIFKIWPGENDGYEVEIISPSNGLIKLKPSLKLAVEGLLAHFRTPEIKSVKGILGTLQVMPNRKIMRIVGPDGQIKCFFSKEKEELAKKLIGKPVIVYGQATFDANGNVIEIIDVTQLKQFTDIELQRIFSEDKELQLLQPIIVTIDYRDDFWIMENEELGITSMASDYDECLRDFNNQFFLLWKEYGKADNSELTYDAINLKSKVLQYMEPENVVQ